MSLRTIHVIALCAFLFGLTTLILVSKVKDQEKEEAKLLMIQLKAKTKEFEEKEKRHMKQLIELNDQLSVTASQMKKKELLRLDAENKVENISKELLSLKEKSKDSSNIISYERISPFKGKRLVHLDLKGAPPLLNYLIQTIRHMKQLGAEGLLIEYEDMFPWEGEFNVLKSKNAYTKLDIAQILNVASEENLEVIPLIQTFGHLEFLLKHPQFKHLRADKEITNVICPIKDGSVPLIKAMLKQIIEMHPRSKFLHLGGDEVYNLRTCEKCKTSNLSDFGLYTNHMVPLFKYVKELNLQPIIWDDMLRKWDADKLKFIGTFVMPMIWGYVADMSRYRNFPDGMWERFAQAFPKLWIASSFKGALKPWSNFVPLQQHLDNHLSWLVIVSKLKKMGSEVVGVAITGWSRFDHYGPLCELFPAGIPSLALCLAVLQKGKFDNDLHAEVSKLLGFETPFKIRIPSYKDYSPETAGYSGGQFYNVVGTLEKAIGYYDWSNVRIRGWTRESISRTRSFSYYQVNTTLSGLTKSKELLLGLEEKASASLSEMFDKDTVDEWVEDKIRVYLNRVNSVIDRIKPLLDKALS